MPELQVADLVEVINRNKLNSLDIYFQKDILEEMMLFQIVQILIILLGFFFSGCYTHWVHRSA